MADVKFNISVNVEKMLEAFRQEGYTVQKWIPCSKQMPESGEDVLVWFEYYRYGDYDGLYQTYGIGTYYAYHKNWLINQSTGWHNLRVIAWMPLPDPYEEMPDT